MRLFIYHREAEELEPALRSAFQDQYALMERRLANIITTPGMVVAVAMAVVMVVTLAVRRAVAVLSEAVSTGAKKAKRSGRGGAELKNLLKKPLVIGGVLALSAAIGIALLRGKRR